MHKILNMKKIIYIINVFLLSSIFNLLPLTGQTLISTVEELAAINTDDLSLKGEYLLTKDLVLENWTPIGTGKSPFVGIFDGYGHTITILSFKVNTNIENKAFNTISIGLFGSIGKGSVVKNLRVAGELSYDSGPITLYMGAIAGDNNGTIMNCISTANINANGGQLTSGRAWAKFGLSLLGSANSNYTTYLAYQNEACGGGITGVNKNLIENCYATGNITVSGEGHKNAGGIAGRNGFTDIMVDNIRNNLSGNLKGGVIIYCYATGNISAKQDVATRQAGGITGMSMPGSVTNSVALNKKVETIGRSKGVGFGGLGVGYPANLAFGVTSYNILEPILGSIPTRGFALFMSNVKICYVRNNITNYINYGNSMKNAYYRNDMEVYMEKDEEGDMKNKVNNKKLFLQTRGEKIEYTSTQEESWWTDNKSGVFYNFGSDENNPWVWVSELKRPALFWEIIPFD